MVEPSTSGKRVVAAMLGLVLIIALIAWIAAMQLEKRRSAQPAVETTKSSVVLSEGILYEAQPGDSAIVVAKEVASGKELWRAELGSIKTSPVLVIHEELIEVQIAGTPWMTLDRNTGEPVD